MREHFPCWRDLCIPINRQVCGMGCPHRFFMSTSFCGTVCLALCWRYKGACFLYRVAWPTAGCRNDHTAFLSPPARALPAICAADERRGSRCRIRYGRSHGIDMTARPRASPTTVSGDSPIGAIVRIRTNLRPPPPLCNFLLGTVRMRP